MAVNDPMVDGLLEVGRRMRKCSDFEGRMRHVVNAVHAALMVSDDRFAFTEEQRDQLLPEVTCGWLEQAFPDLISAHVDHFRPGEQRKVKPADDDTPEKVVERLEATIPAAEKPKPAVRKARGRKAS